MAVYFMQSVTGGPVKIGHSINVHRRRENLEWAYGTPLTVLATMQGGRKEEAAIHARFSHLRLGQTEQFMPASELMAFIERPLLADQDAESVEAMPSKMKSMVAQLRGSGDFKAWLEKAAQKDGRTVSNYLVRAAVVYARQIGFDDPFPDR